MTTADAPTDPPATWENVVVGKATELVGRVIGSESVAEDGENQVEIAYDVREDFDGKRFEDDPDGSSPA